MYQKLDMEARQMFGQLRRKTEMQRDVAFASCKQSIQAATPATTVPSGLV